MSSNAFAQYVRRQNWIDRLFVRGYRKRLMTALNALVGREADVLYRRIEQQAAGLVEANQAMIVDKASGSHLLLVAILLASYRVLGERFGDKQKAQDLIRSPFLDSGKGVSRGMMNMMAIVTRDPFKTMVKISKTKQAAYYGRSFIHQAHQDDARAYVMHVSKCFYFDFFKAQGAVELMPMFCAKDNNWSDAIDPAKLGFQFNRPTTLGTGGTVCEFRFERVAPAVDLMPSS